MFKCVDSVRGVCSLGMLLFIIHCNSRDFSLLESYAAEGSCMEAQRNDLEAKVDGKGFLMKWGFLFLFWFSFVFVRLRKAEDKEKHLELLDILPVNGDN